MPPQWESDRQGLLEQGTTVVSALLRHSAPALPSGGAAGAPVTPPTIDVMNKCYKMLEERYDEVMGGFGSAPKFPQPGMAVEWQRFLKIYET